MANVFTEIAKGFVWLGKKIAEGWTDVSKVITVVPILENAAPQLAQDSITIINDAGKLSLAAIADGGTVVTEFEAILADASSGNIAAAVTAAETLFSEVTNVTNFQNILAAVKQLAADCNSFASQIKTDATEIEQATAQ